jgi:arylsulfatase A-like enzyme
MPGRKFSRRKFLGRGSAAAAVSGLIGTAGSEAVSGAVENPAAAGGVWEKPPDQKKKGNRLNLILLNVDTFRADNLECYGSQYVECPHLNRFAKDCVIFENAYPEVMPTIAIRRNLMTGRRILPTYYHPQHEIIQAPGWHQLYHEDVTMAETLYEAGYITALISDILHLTRPDRNFHRGYRNYEWIRGQSFDFYGTVPHQPMDVSDVVPDDYLKKWQSFSKQDNRWFLSQYKVNKKRWLEEGESLIAIIAKRFIDWLKRNQEQKPFFLHMEAFDPHEPWDPPKRFLDQYMPNATGPSWGSPPYAEIRLPEEGARRMRANYAAESSCVDYWVGEILNAIGELGLFDNSIVVFMSDHGALLGEQGDFAKGPKLLRRQVTHIPLLVRLPNKEHAGKRVSGFVQITDIMPTLLGQLGLQSPSRVTGKDCWGLVTGETRSIYDHAVQGYGWIGAVRTPEWNLSAVWNPKEYKGNYVPQLYSREKDPDELTDVAKKYPDVVADLKKKIDEYIAAGEGLTRGSFHGRPT